MKEPKVSVLMPVFNCEQFIKDAVDSILKQTLFDFELIIIDDASTDDTVKILKRYKDPRIKIIVKPKNSGHTKSLNYGLSIAKGQYIARMDGDDISLPDRFKLQVDFMDNNLDYVVCGTFYKIIGSSEVKTIPVDHEAIKVFMLHKTPFGHPTVMIRGAILNENNLFYDEDFAVAQDYEFWIRLLAYGKFHNLEKILLEYRVHDNQVSKHRIDLKKVNVVTAKLRLLDYLDYERTNEDEVILKKILLRQILVPYEIDHFFSMKEKLLAGNKKGFFLDEDFRDFLKSLENLMFKDFFFLRKRFKPSILLNYIKIKIKYKYSISRVNVMKLVVKSLIYYK